MTTAPAPTSAHPARGERFRIPSSERLIEAATALHDALAIGADVPTLRTASKTAAEAWVETLIDGFLLTLAAAARGPGAGRRTATTVRDLAAGLIDNGTRRLDGDGATRLDEFLTTHLDDATPPRIALAVTPTLAAALDPALATPTPPLLASALHVTVDAMLAGLLDAPLALLELGFFARTATKLGRVAVTGRIHGEVDRAVKDPAAAERLHAMLLAYVAP